MSSSATPKSKPAPARKQSVYDYWFVGLIDLDVGVRAKRETGKAIPYCCPREEWMVLGGFEVESLARNLYSEYKVQMKKDGQEGFLFLGRLQGKKDPVDPLRAFLLNRRRGVRGVEG